MSAIFAFIFKPNCEHKEIERVVQTLWHGGRIVLREFRDELVVELGWFSDVPKAFVELKSVVEALFSRSTHARVSYVRNAELVRPDHVLPERAEPIRVEDIQEKKEFQPTMDFLGIERILLKAPTLDSLK